jgi:hypothetical protein
MSITEEVEYDIKDIDNISDSEIEDFVDPKLLILIEEFAIQRAELNNMIKDLEKIKAKIDTLFPENLDKRYIRFFEEKMKSLTSLFGTILDIRKEIMKSVKTEFDLRKHLTEISDNSDDPLNDFDIDQFDKAISKLKKDHDKQKAKRVHLRKKGESHVKLETIN